MKTGFSPPIRRRMLALAMVFVVVFPEVVDGQQSVRDSLDTALNKTAIDTNKVSMLLRLCDVSVSDFDLSSARKYGAEAISMAKKLSFPGGEARAHAAIGLAELTHEGDPEAARRHFERAEEIDRIHHEVQTSVRILQGLGTLARRNGNSEEALRLQGRALKLAEDARDPMSMSGAQFTLADSYRIFGRLTQAMEYYQRALMLRERLSDRIGTAECLDAMGTIAYKSSDFGTALQYYRKALDLHERLGQSAAATATTINLGIVLVFLYRFPEARELLERGLSLAEKLGNNVWTLNALRGLARTLQELGKYDAAKAIVQRGYALAKSSGDRKRMAQFRMFAGDVAFHERRFDEAWGMYRQSMAQYEEINDRAGVDEVRRQIGEIHSRSGRPERAIEIHMERLRESRQSGDSLKIFDALTSIAQVYSGQRKSKKASEKYQEALQVASGLGIQTAIAASLICLGREYESQGDWQEAISYLDRGLKTSELAQDKDLELRALGPLARIYSHVHRDDLALAYSSRMKNAAIACGSRWAHEEALITIADIHLHRGEKGESLASLWEYLRMETPGEKLPTMAAVLCNIGLIHLMEKRFTEALDTLNLSLMIKQESHDTAGCGPAYVNIGQCLQALGKYTEAEAALLHGLAIAKSHEDKRVSRDALAALNNLASQIGDYKLAHTYLTDYIRINDSIVNEAGERAMVELAAKYDSEKKQQRILLLEKDKALQSSELDRRQKEIALQSLRVQRYRQQSLLLAQRNDIQRMDLNAQRTDAELQRTRAERATAQSQRSEAMRKEEATVAIRLRNSILAGVLLLCVVGYLIVSKIQHKRREATLRAEAAEFQAQAAEAQATAASMETERREKELQQQFSRQLIEAQEQERTRIAREMHDGVGQEALVVKNQLYRVLHHAAVSENVKELLEQATGVVTGLVEDVRRIAHDLRPVQLERAGLTGTLQELVAQVEGSSHLMIDAEIDDVDDLFEPGGELTIFRIVQEGMGNILRHASASHVGIRLRRDNGRLFLSLEDDGAGFDHAGNGSKGMGIRTMTERVQMLGGTFRIESSIGEGTRLSAEIPIPKPESRISDPSAGGIAA